MHNTRWVCWMCLLGRPVRIHVRQSHWWNDCRGRNVRCAPHFTVVRLITLYIYIFERLVSLFMSQHVLLPLVEFLATSRMVSWWAYAWRLPPSTRSPFSLIGLSSRRSLNSSHCSTVFLLAFTLCLTFTMTW